MKRAGPAEPEGATDDKKTKTARRVLTPLEKDTLSKLVSHLEEHPEKIYTEFCRMTSSIAEKTRRSADTSEWNSTYCYWRQISKSWLANVIVSFSERGQTGLTTQFFDNFDVANPDGIRQLCVYLFGIRGDNCFLDHVL